MKNAIIASAVALAACGGAQKPMERHLFAIETLEDMAVEARGAALEYHDRKVREAAEQAKADDRSPEDAARAASAEYRVGTVHHRVNTFIAAKRAYANALVLAIAEEDDIKSKLLSSEAKLLLASVIDAYESLRHALPGAKLPPVPDLIRQLLLTTKAGENEQEQASTGHHPGVGSSYAGCSGRIGQPAHRLAGAAGLCHLGGSRTSSWYERSLRGGDRRSHQEHRFYRHNSCNPRGA